MKSFSWIKLFPVQIHLKYWYYNTLSLQLHFLHYTISVKVHTGQLKVLFNRILIMHVLHRFSYFSYPIWSHATSTGYAKPICQAKPLKFIIKIYADHNNLWVKHTTHQKAESLRAGALSKWANMVNSNSIFNIKCAELPTKWYKSFNFQKPTYTCNHFYNPFLQSSQLWFPYSCLVAHKTIFKILTNTSFL